MEGGRGTRNCELPRELTQEIFYKLPVKTLVRCTSVCKSWSKMIKGTDFISTHLERALCTYSNTNNEGDAFLLILGLKDEFRYILHVGSAELIQEENRVSHSTFIYTDGHQQLKVNGLCNGLVCLSYYDEILLWNPSIRRSRIVRKISTKDTFRYINIDDPSVLLGFGFDSETKDYKILKIVNCVSSQPPTGDFRTYFELYSLKSNCWKIVESKFDSDIRIYSYDSPCFANGSLHIMAFSTIISEIGKVIVAFDVGGEVFSKIMLPESLDIEEPDFLHIVGYRGGFSIAVVRELLDYHAACFGGEVWVMTTYGRVDSWTKLFSVTDTVYALRVLGFRKNGQVLVDRSKKEFPCDVELEADRMMVLDGLGEGIVSCDFESKKHEYLWTWRKASYNRHLGSCVESLALLDEGDAVRDEIITNSASDANSEDSA